MLSYTTVGVNDLLRALRFYGPLFKEMGLDQCFLDQTSASWGRNGDASFTRFSIGYPFNGLPASAGNGAMTAFLIDSPARIDRLHELAMKNGGGDEGSPGRRPRYGGSFYGAYARDPDGNKLAFVCFDSPMTPDS
jgi:catechol 2,3-dioxygenase-like lactoylglutathione lyase family enzyme